MNVPAQSQQSSTTSILLNLNRINPTYWKPEEKIGLCEAQSREQFAAPDDFSVDMCDGFFDAEEEAALFQTYSVDDEVDVDDIFNHLDYVVQVDEEIGMDMTWDNGALGCVVTGSSRNDNVHVKEEMDQLVEMVAATPTQNCSGQENNWRCNDIYATYR